MPDQSGFWSDDEINANTPEGQRLARQQREGVTQVPGAPGATDTGATASDQWLYGDTGNPIQPIIRDALIGANQGAIGLLGLPDLAARGIWNTARSFAPGMGAPPDWMEPQTYGSALTVPGLTPQTPTERSIAAGAREAGTALPLTGPRGALWAGLGGFGGQEVREHRGPEFLAEGLDIAGGLKGASGYGGWGSVPALLDRAGYLPTWLGGTTPMSDAERIVQGIYDRAGPEAADTTSEMARTEAGHVADIRNMDLLGAAGNIATGIATGHYGGILGDIARASVPAVRFIRSFFGSGTTPASSVAHKILGIAIGGQGASEAPPARPAPGAQMPNMFYRWTDQTPPAGPMPMAPLAPQ